jgi:hypothetical protein
MSETHSIPTHPLFVDLTGKTVGRLKVVSYHGRRRKSGKGWAHYWNCACECGNSAVVPHALLIKDHTRSCGCLQRERAADAQRTHGRCREPEYGIWSGIKARCLIPTFHMYPAYGGAGIRICRRWADSYTAFAADMGRRPSKSHSVDRADNARGYECGHPECPDCEPAKATPNCRWATRKVQNRNTKRNRVLTFNGKTQTAADWAEELGMPVNTIYSRLNVCGWSVDRALSTPRKSPRVRDMPSVS